MSINQRVNEVLTHYKDSKADLARKMSVTPQYISKILGQGKKGIGLDFINQFTDIYQAINVRWLIKGIGSMLPENTVELNEPKEVYQKQCSNCQQLQKIVDHQEKMIQRYERELDELRERSKDAC